MRELELLLRFLMAGCDKEGSATASTLLLFGQPGAPSSALHAAKIYHAGRARKIIVSGGESASGIMPPDGFKTDGEYYRDILLRHGVPEGDVILEGGARNTLENVLIGLSAGERAGLSIESLIYVSIPPHMMRCKLTIEKHFPKLSTHGSCYVPNMKAWCCSSKDGANRILGEMQRVLKYGAKGDIAFAHVPREIMKAFESALKNFGFDPDTTISWTEGHLWLD